MYLFGPENGSLDESMLERCTHVVSIPGHEYSNPGESRCNVVTRNTDVCWLVAQVVQHGNGVVTHAIRAPGSPVRFNHEPDDAVVVRKVHATATNLQRGRNGLQLEPRVPLCCGANTTPCPAIGMRGLGAA